MKNTVTSCIKQAVLSEKFLLGALSVAVLLLLSSTEEIVEAFRSEELLAYGFHGSLMVKALGSDTMKFAFPIVCTLPYATAYVDDMKSGFIKSYIGRTSRKAYILGKIAGCVVSGGLVIVLGILLAYGLSTLVFLPMEAPPPEQSKAGGEYLVEILASCGMFFLSGGFWALLGMTLSSPMESRYIAYASPFIVFYILIILHERYFSGLYVLYPPGWLFPGSEWKLGEWGVVILLLELLVIVSLCFDSAVRRRFSEA